MKSGYVVSDLHLFTRRSLAEQYMDRLWSAAGDADFFVLNGDIVDFRWSIYPSNSQTADVAIDWLRRFTGDFPACRFIYVMGNHDGTKYFAERLNALTGEIPQFEWHPSHVRLGAKLFLHGDLPIHNTDSDPFHRDLAEEEERWSSAWNVLYTLFVSSRSHRLARLYMSPRKCARRILTSLQSDHRGLADGVTDVYFGHTHSPFSDFRFDGLTFHNTGSAIQHLECRLLEVEI